MAAADDFDVTVQGAGCVGSALALALSRLGLRVALHRSMPAPGAADDVRAYALNAASIELLRGLKVWEALPPHAATPVYEMVVHGDAHASRLAFSAWQQRVGALAWIADAAALERELATALRFAPHVTLIDADADGDRPVGAALVACCEGRDSAARAALGVTFDRLEYGHRAIAARLVASRPHGGCARQWFGAPDVLALLPLDLPEPSRSYALVWSLPEARAASLLALDDAAFERELAAVADGELGRTAGHLALASPRRAWPLALGDAAHTVHPLAGQGLNLGLADVAALVDVIAAREPWRALGDERLLRRYARRRAGPTRAMAGITDGLWHLFAEDSPLVRELRNRGLGLVDAATPLKRWLTAHALGA